MFERKGRGRIVLHLGEDGSVVVVRMHGPHWSRLASVAEGRQNVAAQSVSLVFDLEMIGDRLVTLVTGLKDVYGSLTRTGK